MGVPLPYLTPYDVIPLGDTLELVFVFVD